MIYHRLNLTEFNYLKSIIDHLARSCETWRSVTQSRGKKEYPAYNILCCPRLEQYIVFQLPSTSDSSIQMSSSHW